MKAPPPYAAGTAVSIDRSTAEATGLLRKHGASMVGIMNDDVHGLAFIHFVLRGRAYQVEVPLPRSRDFTDGSPERQRKLYDQACRERWRAAVLMLKTKLELIRINVSTPEREFLADLVVNGQRLLTVLSGAGQPLALPAAKSS